MPRRFTLKKARKRFGYSAKNPYIRLYPKGRTEVAGSWREALDLQAQMMFKKNRYTQLTAKQKEEVTFAVEELAAKYRYG